MGARSAVVVGNPRPGSRTLRAATTVVRRLTDAEPDLVVDLATVGAALLDWQDPTVVGLVEEVGAADLVVVASPTYKATYAGVLKLFLDRFAGGVGLRGVTVPLMVGAAPRHALAAELHLRPLLVELGGTVPSPALYLLEHDVDRPEAYDGWVALTRPLVAALTARTTGVPA